MRTKVLAVFAIALSVAACKKEIKLEVKQIQETDKTAQWDIQTSHPVFSSTETDVENSCVKFNDEMGGLVHGIQAAFMEQAKESIASLDSAGIKQIAPYQLIIQDTVTLANENYISVRVLSYEMLGGAHGMTNFYGVNYDVKNQKFLNKKDILNLSKASEINALLKANLKDPDNCFSFEAPTVDNLTAINITQHSIEFTYAQYILGPYSCGPATISVPREKMQGMLMLK